MNTLVIMAKHPVAGQVKTRLAKSVGDTTAAESVSYTHLTLPTICSV